MLPVSTTTPPENTTWMKSRTIRILSISHQKHGLMKGTVHDTKPHRGTHHLELRLDTVRHCHSSNTLYRRRSRRGHWTRHRVCVFLTQKGSRVWLHVVINANGNAGPKDALRPVPKHGQT